MIFFNVFFLKYKTKAFMKNLFILYFFNFSINSSDVKSFVYCNNLSIYNSLYFSSIPFFTFSLLNFDFTQSQK